MATSHIEFDPEYGKFRRVYRWDGGGESMLIDSAEVVVGLIERIERLESLLLESTPSSTDESKSDADV